MHRFIVPYILELGYLKSSVLFSNITFEFGLPDELGLALSSYLSFIMKFLN